MDIRENFKKLQQSYESNDKEYWEKFYSKDVVRRIAGCKPLIGRDACKLQHQEYLDSLTSPPQFEMKSVAFDDDNNVCIYEFYHEFSSTKYGEIRQMQVHVQRWRDEKIFEESIYAMPLDLDGNPKEYDM